eukprot:scaffold1219_cov400-Prasinococcus_capsulatus_cf.AAC.21
MVTQRFHDALSPHDLRDNTTRWMGRGIPSTLGRRSAWLLQGSPPCPPSRHLRTSWAAYQCLQYTATWAWGGISGSQRKLHSTPPRTHTGRTWYSIPLALHEYPSKPIALHHPAGNPGPGVTSRGTGIHCSACQKQGGRRTVLAARRLNNGSRAQGCRYCWSRRAMACHRERTTR